ncbi:cell division protein ZapA [Treponema sp. C6A8]|uniref:cell division protein ZapA n=1 Tax=Treponema sp. C6A8 TaxID=1410609 RepID=UPI0004853682|nr:cell division protein ZapA [Treponema sp. C6A8]
MGKLHINTLGTSFTIQANGDDEYLQKLLTYYNRVAEDAQKITALKTPLQTAILAGIMLCDEVYKEKQNKIALETEKLDPDVILQSNDIERHTLDMIEKINKVL